MRPSPFRYTKPATLAGALQALEAGAVPLAGGQSLLQAMRLRTVEPDAVCDLNSVAELSADIVRDDRALHIGALTTHALLASHLGIGTDFPWLAGAALALGDVQVRNRGTVLGNVCWADPRANMAVALLASDAVVRAIDPADPARVETLALQDFFLGFRRNALRGRLAIGIEVPRTPPHTRGCYLEFSRQRQDLALCNVCVVASRDWRHTRIAVGGIHDRPLRLVALEQTIAARGGVGDHLAGAIDSALAGLALTPIADPYGSPAYKQHLATVLIKQALEACATGASHE